MFDKDIGAGVISSAFWRKGVSTQLRKMLDFWTDLSTKVWKFNFNKFSVEF